MTTNKDTDFIGMEGRGNSQQQVPPNQNQYNQQQYQQPFTGNNNGGYYQQRGVTPDAVNDLFKITGLSFSGFGNNANLEILNKLMEEIKKVIINNTTTGNAPNVGIMPYTDQHGNSCFIITRKIPLSGSKTPNAMGVFYVTLLIESLSRPTSPFVETNQVIDGIYGNTNKLKFPISGASGLLKPKLIEDIKLAVVDYYKNDNSINPSNIIEASTLVVPATYDLRDPNNVSSNLISITGYVFVADQIIAKSIRGLAGVPLTDRKAIDISKIVTNGLKLEIETELTPGETGEEFGHTYAKDVTLITKGRLEIRNQQQFNMDYATNDFYVLAAASATVSIQKTAPRRENQYSNIFQGIRPVINVTNLNCYTPKYQQYFGENSFPSIFLGLASFYTWLQNLKIMRVFEHSSRPGNKKAGIGNVGLYYDQTTGQFPVKPEVFKVTQTLAEMGSTNPDGSEVIIPLNGIYNRMMVKPAAITLDVIFGDPMYWLTQYLLVHSQNNMHVILSNLDNFYQVNQQGKLVTNLFTQIWEANGRPSVTIPAQGKPGPASTNILLGHYFDKHGNMRDLRHYNEILNLLGELQTKDQTLLRIFEQVNHPGYYNDNLLATWYDILNTQLLAATESSSFQGSPNTIKVTGIGKRVYINPVFLACVDQANAQCGLLMPDTSMNINDLLIGDTGLFYNFDEVGLDKLGPTQSYRPGGRGYQGSPFSDVGMNNQFFI